jgi:Arc/MetJ family transcription regulator
MRTNIVLDEDLIERARQLTGLKTKRAVVREALRTLIQVREQSQVRDLRGKLHWEADLDSLRLGRDEDQHENNKP